MKENSLVPSNEIWYTTVDGKPIDLSESTMGEPVSNTYNDGKGVAVFEGPIECIEESAFEYCRTLQKIVIPESVIEIGAYAFDGCVNLEEIFIPSTVISIFVYAFRGCSNLTKITVEEGNPKYDSREGCNAVIAVRTSNLMCGCRSTVIPSSVKAIRPGAFGYQTGLQEIVIPEGVTEINDDAFMGCSALREIVIPSSVTEIGDAAFCDCSSLEKVVFSSSDTEVSMIAFRGCLNLKAIYVPKDSVERYKEQFPRYMRWLIVEEGSDLPVRDESLVVTEICYTTVDGEPIEISDCFEETAISNTYKEGKGVILLDGTIEEIGENAFDGYDTLQTIVIPAGVTEIGESAFKKCTGLEEIVIPEGVTKIGWCAFDGCSALKKLVIPSSVTEIQSGAFSCCSALSEIDVQSGITYIDAEVFGDCTGLHKIVIPEGVETIYDGAFLRCNNLEEVVIPSSVTQIGRNAFVRCGNIKAIYVPEGKVDYYKKRFPGYMSWLIVEEGSDRPAKPEIVAKDVLFAMRVITLDNETDSNILAQVEKMMEEMSRGQLIEWILEHLEAIKDSEKPYDEDEDSEEAECYKEPGYCDDDEEDEDNYWEDEDEEDGDDEDDDI